jgi:hydroxypyruvate isomerase
MLRFCANATMMFTQYPFLERFQAIRRAGFKGAEILDSYSVTPEELRAALTKAGVVVANMNTPVGNRAAGDVGFACVPGREAEFKASVAKALSVAEAVGAKQVNVLAGIQPKDISRQTCLDLLAENLSHAAGEMAKRGITCSVEAINSKDRPGYILNTTDQAVAVVQAAGNKNLGIEADIYHMGMMGEDVGAALRRHAPHLAHVQFADVPGRHEPGTGGLDFRAIFAVLEEIGYEGWVSAEYEPSRMTEETLAWFERWRD